MFWGKEEKERLHQIIFGDSNSVLPDSKTLINNLYNMITLSPEVHAAWAAGLFVLKPISQDYDPYELRARFQWIPQRNHTDKVKITTDPESFAFLPPVNSKFYNLDTDIPIKDEDIITFRTINPDIAPLPDQDLLRLQSFLIRVLRMAGRFGTDMLETFDSDEEVSSIASSVMTQSRSRVKEDSPQPIFHTKSSTSDKVDPTIMSSLTDTSGQDDLPFKSPRKYVTTFWSLWPRTKILSKRSVEKVFRKAKST